MNNKHLWIIPIYGVLYLISFFLLENSDVELNWIHCALDDRIPFCEYFVIPYVLWYFLIFATLWYFGFRCKDHTEYWQLVASIGTGMTVFLIVSYVYPNGHNLRPVLADGNVFVQAVKLLYRIDTPTNILPSMHVFDAVACAVAFCKNEECRKNKKLIFGVTLLAVLITLSTVFLKQHSLIDVALALLLYAFCYLLFYKIAWQHREWVASLLTKKEVLTIPNLLGVFRLVLAVLFMGICQRHGGIFWTEGLHENSTW
jgi:membrane-associated phospholipid phosphatase